METAEIQRRLEQIELATVSSLRTLQMDIEGDKGVPSALVLKRTRNALTKKAGARPADFAQFAAKYKGMFSGSRDLSMSRAHTS